MDQIKIGQVLKRVLKQQHLTLKEVSQATGIPYSTLHTWYENRQPKDILKAQKLAKYLGLSLQALLFDQMEETEAKFTTNQKSESEDIFKGIFQITVRRIE